MVYFIWNSGTGHVKVGYSADPAGRMSDLQTSNSHPLFMLALMDGGKFEERGIHTHLDRFRLNGEWFEGTAELFREIRALINGGEVMTAPRAKPKVSRRKSRGDVAVAWLTARFKEQREWSSVDLLKLAKEDDISKQGLYSPEVFDLPIKKYPRATPEGRQWFWKALPGWPPEREAPDLTL